MVWYLISYICRKTETLRKITETYGTRKGFVYCWNCTETFYTRFQLTETLRKLFICFPTAETGLKLKHQVSADGNLTESGNFLFRIRNWWHLKNAVSTSYICGPRSRSTDLLRKGLLGTNQEREREREREREQNLYICLLSMISHF